MESIKKSEPRGLPLGVLLFNFTNDALLIDHEFGVIGEYPHVTFVFDTVGARLDGIDCGLQNGQQEINFSANLFAPWRPLRFLIFSAFW